jgi:hypothetical protein
LVTFILCLIFEDRFFFQISDVLINAIYKFYFLNTRDRFLTKGVISLWFVTVAFASIIGDVKLFTTLRLNDFNKSISVKFKCSVDISLVVDSRLEVVSTEMLLVNSLNWKFKLQLCKLVKKLNV